MTIRGGGNPKLHMVLWTAGNLSSAFGRRFPAWLMQTVAISWLMATTATSDLGCIGIGGIAAGGWVWGIPWRRTIPLPKRRWLCEWPVEHVVCCPIMVAVIRVWGPPTRAGERLVEPFLGMSLSKGAVRTIAIAALPHRNRHGPTSRPRRTEPAVSRITPEPAPDTFVRFVEPTT